MSKLALFFRLGAGLNIMIALFAIINFVAIYASAPKSKSTSKTSAQVAGKQTTPKSSVKPVAYVPASKAQVLAATDTNEATPAYYGEDSLGGVVEEPELIQNLLTNDKLQFWPNVGDNISVGRREDRFDSIWLRKFDVDEYGELEARGKQFTFGKEKFDDITWFNLNGNFRTRTAYILKDLTVRGTKIRLGKAGSGDIINTGTVSIAPSGNLYWGSRIICDSSGNCGSGGTGTYENPLTFNNGLTRTSNTVQLGGTLIQTTTIANAGYDFTITGTGNVRIGTASPTNKLHVAQTQSTGASTNVNGTYSSSIFTGTGTQEQITGINTEGFNSSTGTVSILRGALGRAVNSSTGDVTTAHGAVGEIRNVTTGTISTGSGLTASINNASAGTISNAYGLAVKDWINNGTITNLYGVYIDSTVTGATGLNYALYSSSPSDSYFAGNVGIGTTTPGTPLEVNGAITATFATANTERLCWDASGASAITDCTGTPGDYAEHYGSDGSLSAGDLVAIDESKKPALIEKDGRKGSRAWVKKAVGAYNNKVLGVVSTDPNEIIGQNFETSEHPVPVALNGRIPVKVSGENGKIEVGDELTPSSVAGVAMRATAYGNVIGRALESFDGTSKSEQDKILVFVNLSKSLLDTSVYAQGADVEALAKIISSLTKDKLSAADLLKIKDLQADDLKAESLKLTGTLTVTDDTKLAKTTISGNLKVEGDLQAKDLSADSLKLADKVVGSGKIKAGEKSAKIETSAITEDSLVFVALTSANYAVLAVTDKDAGNSFTVSMEKDQSEDVKFDWLVINKVD